MRFDLHCHTEEGSFDSKVSLERYVELLRIRGFDGLMVTDHDSYKGCRIRERIKSNTENRDFVILSGIEYDTKDAGHILVIMPEGIYLPILTVRGMSLKRLIKIVHFFGGILGPAHPYGVKSSSAMHFRKMDMSLLNRMDFFETFNTCESGKSNTLAEDLAQKYNKPQFGGSDAHEEQYVGMAYTELPCLIRNNNDLIDAVKAGVTSEVGGTVREVTRKSIRKEHWTGVVGFKIYNRGLGKLFCLYRSYKHFRLSHDHAI